MTNLANQSNQLSRAFRLISLRSTAYYICMTLIGAPVPLVVFNLLQLKTAVFCIEIKPNVTNKLAKTELL